MIILLKHEHNKIYSNYYNYNNKIVYNYNFLMKRIYSLLCKNLILNLDSKSLKERRFLIYKKLKGSLSNK